MIPVIGSKLARVLNFFGVTGTSIPWVLSRYIVPVFDVRPFVSTPKLATANVDLSVATSVYVVGHTVPVAKRWKLLVYDRAAVVTTGSVPAYSDGTVVVALGASALAETVVLPPDLHLQAGWTVGAYGTGAVNTVALRIHYLEEDA